MSPKVADLFKGHMWADDPRSPLFAAGGCLWPTVPGYNLFIGSTDAWGSLAWLNTEGIQLAPNAPIGRHDLASWILNGGNPPLTWALLKKMRLPDLRGFNWSLGIQPLLGALIVTEASFPIGICNRSFLLPEFTQENIPTGGSGANCKIMQVEWDARRPPDGWPP